MGAVFEKCTPRPGEAEGKSSNGQYKKAAKPEAKKPEEAKSGATSHQSEVRSEADEMIQKELAELEKSFVEAGVIDQNDNDAFQNKDSYFSPEEIEYLVAKFKLNDRDSVDKVLVPHKPKKIKWQGGEMLGMGSFGRVIQGLNLSSGELMAIKQVPLTGFNVSQDRINALQLEIELLKQLNHRNIVRYIGSSQKDGTLNICLEFVAGGSIATLLSKFGRFNEKLIQIYTKQILEGLEYLHANRLIHRDIKGANVLVDNGGVCKLADFGSAKRIVPLLEAEKYQSVRGTANWMAPEVIKQSGHGRQADIWSVGCTVIEMATGKPPWSEFDNQYSAMFHIAQCTGPPAIPQFLSPECRDFLLCCLKPNPKERPNVHRLLKHPFIVGAKKTAGFLEQQLPTIAEVRSSTMSASIRHPPMFEFDSNSSSKSCDDQAKKSFESAPNSQKSTKFCTPDSGGVSSKHGSTTAQLLASPSEVLKPKEINPVALEIKTKSASVKTSQSVKTIQKPLEPVVVVSLEEPQAQDVPPSEHLPNDNSWLPPVEGRLKKPSDCLRQPSFGIETIQLGRAPASTHALVSPTAGLRPCNWFAPVTQQAAPLEASPSGSLGLFAHHSEPSSKQQQSGHVASNPPSFNYNGQFDISHYYAPQMHARYQSVDLTANSKFGGN